MCIDNGLKMVFVEFFDIFKGECVKFLNVFILFMDGK